MNKPYQVYMHDSPSGAFFMKGGPVFTDDDYAIVDGCGGAELDDERIATVLLALVLSRALRKAGLLDPSFDLAAWYGDTGKVERNVFPMFSNRFVIVHDCCNESFIAEGGPFRFVIRENGNATDGVVFKSVQSAVQSEFTNLFQAIKQSEHAKMARLNASLGSFCQKQPTAFLRKVTRHFR